MSSTALHFEADETFAKRLDADDALRSFRDQFRLPCRPDGTPLVYLCGHSLGLQPTAARAFVEQELDDWARLGVEGHFRGATPWFAYHETLRDAGARLVGALPHEVVFMNSLTVNLHLLMATFYRPDERRRSILIDEPSFPSDLYAMQSQLRHHGQPSDSLLSVRPRAGEHTVRLEDVEELLERRGAEIAVVWWNGVNFLTGQFFDLARLTAAAHRQGCVVGLDLAHAAGNVPLRLHDWGVDCAVWCSYKYLNGGPGAIGGCYVHETHGRNTGLTRLAGWWGNDPATRFRMHLQPDFVPREGADGWQVSNPPILAMAPLRASLALFDAATVPALRTKSERLTAYLLYLLDRLPAGRFEVMTPRAPDRRGSQLSLLVHDQPRELMTALEKRGVLCDFREPNVIRVAPVPLYNTFHDVWMFAQAVAQPTGEWPMPEEQPIAIVGAGLAGALLACYLGRSGQRVALYEKRPDPRVGPADRGRSINLALSVRGIHALREVGLADEVLRNSVLMRGRMIHARDGALTFQPYGKDDDEALHSVSRAGLNRLLVEAAGRHDSVRLFFSHKCIGLEANGGTVEFLDEKQTHVTVDAAAVIGTDGAFSAVRSWMQKHEGFNYRQDYLSHGYKELSIPAAADGTHRLEKHALHIWPRGSFMMIALPNLDGSFTCTLFWPFEGPNSFAALTTAADVLAFFRDQFPDAVPLIPALAEEFLTNPTGSLVTIRCQPWRVGRAVLLGDACHAVVPFLGQGMNAAFEDCTVLHQCLLEAKWDWPAASARYETLRKPHTDTLADLCVDNFVEMRDRVASPWFLLRKRVTILLHWLLPRWYLPLYTMIEFTRIPYGDAVRRVRSQNILVTSCAIVVLGLIIVGCVLLLRGSS